MFNIKRNDNKRSINLFLFILIIFNIMVPSLIGSINFGSNSNTFTSYDFNTHPNPSDFSTYNITQILSEEKYALGNIIVNDINFGADLENGIYVYNTTYSDLWEDYASGALNIIDSDLSFIETIEPAVQDNLNEKVKDRSLITVKINESVGVRFNNPQEGYLIYHTRLFPSRLSEFFVDDGTGVDELDSETDYTIDDDGFIVFNYSSHFQPGPIPNFFMYLIWEYDIEVDTWRLSQETKPTLNMKENEVNLTIDYNYYFVLNGKKLDDNINTPSVFANDTYFSLTVDLPDKNSLSNHVLELNNESVVITDHLTANKSINIFLADSFSGNQSMFSLNFTTVFTIKFINPVGETWAIDRLFAKRNYRERVYFPSIVSGPKHIILKFLSIYEPTIYYEQVISATSLFERDVAFFETNTSVTGRQGINITIPYLIKGETCPFMIKYETSQILRIVITDNIKMPITGASIEVYYYGQKFGTYVSTNQSQPIGLTKSNENGEILLRYVPHGNYSIKVFFRGYLIKESDASTYKDVNYIYTNIPHFPLLVLIFGIINVCILIIGVFFYLKYKNKR
ncbi:hypothetical protein LCGC14_1138520 [marine sediment metagenome]|uniref:Carboxypeptidase regulatory-like domain-containing protein n=1 Tax=marine sediment metagenome TaxID=412755 RepID=A0A0F9PH63_9ZZZZ